MPWVALSTRVDVQNETVTAFPDISYWVVSQPSIRWLLVDKSGNQGRIQDLKLGVAQMDWKILKPGWGEI